MRAAEYGIAIRVTNAVRSRLARKSFKSFQTARRHTIQWRRLRHSANCLSALGTDG